MKRLLLLVFLFSVINLFPQAQNYFPQSTGYKWTYKVSPLDSLNNEIDSLSYYQVDSFAVSSVYQGVDANIILSKSGSPAILPYIPYIDSSFVNFSGNDASIYFRPMNFDSLAALIDSLFGDSLFPGLALFDLFESFQGWYTYYKFSSNINASYQIFKFDTTLTVDSLELPLRCELKGKRIADGELNTEIGTFTCKKFIITAGLSYLVIPPWPLPVVPVPIVSLNDTVYIAPGHWELKHITPSTVIDLSYFQLGTYTIPGLKTEIVSGITSVENETNPPSDFVLEQNYPNPFNPSTKISYRLSQNEKVTLKVYDLLGNVAAVLVNEQQGAGVYDIIFNSAEYKLSSGVYFYTLSAGSFKQTKKMILIK